VVDLLQIHHILRKKPGSLSGGDKQRVALGRALVRKPSAFIEYQITQPMSRENGGGDDIWLDIMALL